MVGIYFSGTGNTRFCVEKFVHSMDETARCIAIEDTSTIQAIKQSDTIVLAYPIYFSNLPKIMRDFLDSNRNIFYGKNVFIIATMGLFSGDGTGCAARVLKKSGAKIIGGLHIRMPDCIGDKKLLKKTKEKNHAIIKHAEEKIEKAVATTKGGKAPREGLSFLYHMAGLFGQRLWFYNKTKHYSDKLKINAEKCVGCGICAKLCPMGNLSIENGTAISCSQCTMCYRCISNCPQQAITLLGNTLYEQYKIEKRTEIIDYLGKEVFVKVDRPLGSIHPEHNDIQYEVNYGFLPNTTAADNEEQDAYIIGVNEPLDHFEGIVKAIIVRNDDFEDKLVVCANDYSLTREEIKNKTDFQEKYFDIKIIM